MNRGQVRKKFVGGIERTSLSKIFFSFLELILLGHSLLSRTHQNLYALVSAVTLSFSNKFSHNNHQKRAPIVNNILW